MNAASATPDGARADRTFYAFNAILSATALAVIAYVLLGRRAPSGELDLRFMPAVNASLNALSASLLVAGYIAIRHGARKLHQYAMVSAFASSALFFVGYLAYHSVHGDTKYLGQGSLRAVYFAVLISHIVLSAGLVPMSLTTLYFAWRKTFPRHRNLARWTLPIWLYVSVTGVVIFFMLRAASVASEGY